MHLGWPLEVPVELHRPEPIIILNKLYSWYVYHENEEDMGMSISAASYIGGEAHLVPQATHSYAPDINEDPLTALKDFKYVGP